MTSTTKCLKLKLKWKLQKYIKIKANSEKAYINK